MPRPYYPTLEDEPDAPAPAWRVWHVLAAAAIVALLVGVTLREEPVSRRPVREVEAGAGPPAVDVRFHRYR